MSTIVAIDWNSLAIGTEIGVMAHSALVAVANNVGLVDLALAERTVTEDAVVLLVAARRWCHDFIDWNETVPWVDMASTLDASGAKVPIRTVHAFMANAIDVLPTVNNCA